MKAICLDSAGAWLCECTLEGTQHPVISEIERQTPALDADFSIYPVLSQGFYDSHLHPSWMARLEGQLDCRNKSADEILCALQTFKGEEVLGYGWDESSLNCSLEKFKRLLDKVPQKIILYRVCRHMAYVSQKGFLKDQELETQLTLKLNLEKFESVLRNLENVGIDTWSDLLVSAEDFSILSKYDGLLFGDYRALPLFQKNIRKPTYIKFFLDGSLGAHSAWLSQPYLDKETTGQQLWSDENLKEAILSCIEAGYLTAFHAIGDAALDQLLRISEKLSNKFKNNLNSSFLHRIEHLQVCRDDQIEKISKQGFWSLGLQPSHRLADKSFSLLRLGQERLEKNAYRLKSFKDAGIKISLGSDAPIVSYFPQKTFEAISSDTRKNETLSLGEIYKLFCVEGRQNAGRAAKKLLKNSKAWLSVHSL